VDNGSGAVESLAGRLLGAGVESLAQRGDLAAEGRILLDQIGDELAAIQDDGSKGSEGQRQCHAGQ